MKSFEDPIQFDIRKTFDETEIIYTNLMEISQGGPEIGNLSINGEMVRGRYGGPALYKDGFLFVPLLIKKFFRTGFQLVKIDTVTLRFEHIGEVKNLIFLDKIESNRIYFYEDMNRSIQKFYQLG